jgi:hypothetical protein
MEQMDWPIDDPHGFELSPEDALRLARTVNAPKLAARLTGAKPVPGKGTTTKALPRITVPGVSTARLASLPDAAALLAVLVRELKPQRLIFSSWGLREGLLANGFDAATRAADPMLAGVAAFAATYGPNCLLWRRRWCAGRRGPCRTPCRRTRRASSACGWGPPCWRWPRSTPNPICAPNRPPTGRCASAGSG